MSPIYNQYSRLSADPEHDPAREGERMIFGPLFKTGFLIEHFMRGENWFGASQAILTSASSKTAMGLASVMNERSPGIARIGLTSAANVDFVRRTDLYDQVLGYGDVSSLAEEPSIAVDFAGNPDLLRAIHEHLRDALHYSMLVGVTHIEARGAATGALEDLPGAPPKMFFAPDHAVSLFKALGPAEAGQQIAQSWRTFLTRIAGSVAIETRHGLENARAAYLQTLAGKVDPATGIIIEP